VILIFFKNEFESANLWRKVSEAIEKDDQVAATEEKSCLEETQRNGAKERKAKGYEWVPKHFELVSSILKATIYYEIFAKELSRMFGCT
jgi:hypothetical protein